MNTYDKKQYTNSDPVTYIDPNGKQQTGYASGGHVYTDPEGTTPMPAGSLFTAADGTTYQKTATGAQVYNYGGSGASSAGDWNKQLSVIMDQINNRKPFEFDLNGDALYQQYKEQYQKLGKMAMEDTMGQAAGLTGGYGSTYGQNVGQQAYNAYLDRLNDVVPDIYAKQRSAYDAEGDKLYNQFSLAQQMYGNAKNTEDAARKDADSKVMMMLQMGINPSAADVAASSYTPDEVSKMLSYYQMAAAGGGSSGGGSRSGGGYSSGGSGSGSGNGGGSYGPGVDGYSNIYRTISGYMQTGQPEKAKELFMQYMDQFSESQYNELKKIMGG